MLERVLPSLTQGGHRMLGGMVREELRSMSKMLTDSAVKAAANVISRVMSLLVERSASPWAGLNRSEIQQVRCQSSPTSRIAFERRTFWSAMRSGFIGIVEDLMRLQLRCHSDIDLSQPGMQVEIRSHIARCLRDYPNGGEGVITLGGVEHCFMYVVQNDVVDTVIGPPDYIEQVFNEGRQDMQEGQSPLPRKDHD